MSSSRAIKPKRDESLLKNWESVPERAPSIEREEAPIFARIVAMGGLFFLVLGSLAGAAPAWQTTTIIPPGIGIALAFMGLCPILFHAFVERDQQFRRLYGFVGIGLVLAGVAIRLMAFKGGYGHWFFLYGLPALSVGLILMLGVIRNETERQFQELMVMFLGAVGALMILYCAIQIARDGNFLAGEGAVLLLMALLYVGVFIGQQDTGSEHAYYASLGLGGVGLFGIVAGLLRSFWPESNFLIPGGLILISISTLYLAIALAICVDWPVIVIARRDLAAYFYSPIAYLVLIGLLLIGWWMFYRFVDNIKEFGNRGGVFEPIIGQYIFELFMVIVQIFIIPVLTMRLVSEEIRSGTLEVLMTAPVNEWSVVIGKFLAGWIFYMLTWVPFWVFLIALRFVGGEEFDYRPVLSFTVALGVISAGLLAMGLFFSSITSNQIIAAVLTFVGVMFHLAAYFLRFMEFVRGTPVLNEALLYVNFLDLWSTSLQGIVAPRYLMFHVSVAVFFLFATVKMLESRKWR